MSLNCSFWSSYCLATCCSSNGMGRSKTMKSKTSCKRLCIEWKVRRVTIRNFIKYCLDVCVRRHFVQVCAKETNGIQQTTSVYTAHALQVSVSSGRFAMGSLSTFRYHCSCVVTSSCWDRVRKHLPCVVSSTWVSLQCSVLKSAVFKRYISDLSLFVAQRTQGCIGTSTGRHLLISNATTNKLPGAECAPTCASTTLHRGRNSFQWQRQVLTY